MKPKSIRAAIQMMLPEVEKMLSVGVSREDASKAVSERFGIESMNIRSFDTALYRARQKAKSQEGVASVEIRNETKQKESTPVMKDSDGVTTGIIGKEFFDEIKDSFDPNKFLDKY